MRGEGGVRGRCREFELRRKFPAKRHRPLNPSFSPHAGRRSRERRRRASRLAMTNRSRDASASKFYARAKRDWRNFISTHRLHPLLFSSFTKEEGRRNAGKRWSPTAASCGCGTHPAGARSSVGVPPRLSPKGKIASQRLGFRPGFLGRGLNRHKPPSPVPVQGCTSHPGHNAGRLIPKPPGSGLQNRPRAPRPLHLSASSGRRP